MIPKFMCTLDSAHTQARTHKQTRPFLSGTYAPSVHKQSATTHTKITPNHDLHYAINAAGWEGGPLAHSS